MDSECEHLIKEWFLVPKTKEEFENQVKDKKVVCMSCGKTLEISDFLVS